MPPYQIKKTMREIKFRVWDAGKEDWIYFGLPWKQPELGKQIAPLTVGQFTGLKDKHGKEIYEGDVVRSYHERGEVISSLGSFGCFFDSREFTSLAMIWECGDGHKVEIIGNLYENPELLTN